MSAINPLISNGTCYFGVGRKASSNIIPCGNAASGTQQCCQEGDFCLEYNVCFNANYTTTYLAGCTDEEFTSPSCPGKGTSEQQLLNLVQCADSESESSVVWSTCSMPATRTEIGPPAACTCTDSDNGILTGPKKFSQIASLPTATGETISFQPGYTPTTKGSSTTVTATASNGQLTTATRPLITSYPTASSAAGEDTGLSKGTKAGIGVGVAAFCAAFLALVAFLFIRYRRRHSKKQPVGDAAYQPAAPGPDMAQSPPPLYYGSTPGNPYVPSSRPHDISAFGYPGYTGFKSEIPAMPIDRNRYENRLSELPAGDVAFPTAHRLDRNATPSLLSMPGSPGHLSMVSDLSRAPSVAPSTLSYQGDGYTRGAGTGNMAPIAELYG